MSDIAELFARDPLDMTKDDIKSIVQYLRDSRKQFNQAATAGTKTKAGKKPSLSAEAATELLKNLDI